MSNLWYLGNIVRRWGQGNVEFSEEEKNRARNTTIGIYEHYNEIQNMIEVCVPKLVANKDTLPKMMEKYKNFDKEIESM